MYVQWVMVYKISVCKLLLCLLKKTNALFKYIATGAEGQEC